MNQKQDEQRLAFDLPDEQSAMRLAQQIANACGGTVTVFNESGDDVGRVNPQSVGRMASSIIASIQKLANAMDAETRKVGRKEDDDGTHNRSGP